MALMVKRKGDPYSLLGIAIHPIVTPLTLGTPVSYRDMTPIAKLFSEYQMLVVRTASPIRTLKDVEVALRKDPGSLRSAAPRSGTRTTSRSRNSRTRSASIRQAQLHSLLGGESNPAIMGGHVDVGPGRPRSHAACRSRPHARARGECAQALGGRFKNLPTFSSRATTSSNENWRGIFGPPEMPAPVVQYWRNALAQMEQSPAWKAELEKNQWVHTFETDIFRASLRQGRRGYTGVVKAAGFVETVTNAGLAVAGRKKPSDKPGFYHRCNDQIRTCIAPSGLSCWRSRRRQFARTRIAGLY